MTTKKAAKKSTKKKKRPGYVVVSELSTLGDVGDWIPASTFDEVTARRLMRARQIEPKDR